VSRVLNQQPGLKQKTIERVQRALAETGFTPNAHALHLRGRRTSMVGICMEDLVTPPLVLKLAALQRALRERGFFSLIEVFAPGTSREIVRRLCSMRVEAVVFIGHFPPEEIEPRIVELRALGVPHVVIDQHGLNHANTVSLDRAAGMSSIVRHLLDLGHRSFGLLGVSLGPRSAIDRISGIESTLRAAGLDSEQSVVSLDDLCLRHGDFDYGRALAENFGELAVRPTAYLGYNDEIAIGAMRGFQAAGLRIPQDISVTGFNNQGICRMTSPTLTTIDQNIEGTINTAAELIVTQLNKPISAKPIVRTIEPNLVIGESTGPAPG
jgi:DNA-binding LacI/PurR family transcriptional regulator